MYFDTAQMAHDVSKVVKALRRCPVKTIMETEYGFAVRILKWRKENSKLLDFVDDIGSASYFEEISDLIATHKNYVLETQGTVTGEAVKVRRVDA